MDELNDELREAIAAQDGEGPADVAEVEGYPEPEDLLASLVAAATDASAAAGSATDAASE